MIKKKQRFLIGSVLIWGSLLYLFIHALWKLYANTQDYQHWGVMVAIILIIFGGLWGMKR